MIQTLLKLYYELYFNKKNSNNYLNTTILYVIVLLLFPLSLQYETNLIYIVSLPVICVSYFLIILLTIDNIFSEEHHYGHLLEYYFLRNPSIYMLIIIKILIRWVYISIALSLGIFIGFTLFNLDYIYYFKTTSVLIIITPLLLFIGSISSALLIGLKEKSILISLLTLPFYIPILILTITVLKYILEKNIIFSNSIIVFVFFYIILISIAPQIVIYGLKTWSE